MPYEKIRQNQSGLIIGMKQTMRAMKQNKVSHLFIAADADQNIIDPAIVLAKEQNIPYEHVKSMKELGALCGIDVGTSMASIKYQ